MRHNLLMIFLLLKSTVRSAPVTVPVYNNNYNYQDINARLPNSYYNRLPPNTHSVQVDDVSSNASVNEEDDYDDQQTDKPVINSSYQQASSGNYNNNLYNYLLTENRIKHKRRRKKIRRPCIPIQSINSPLFSNRLKRDAAGEYDSGKTLGLLFGGGQYGAQYYGGGNQGGYVPQYTGSGINQNFDNVKPQYDTGSSAPLYNPYGGYPCVPVSFGHQPLATGPLGFFGPGGLLSPGIAGGFPPLSSPSLNYPQQANPPLSYPQQANPPLSYPQTVIINRPPLFGNKPFFQNNRPGQQGGINSQDSFGSQNEGGFWNSVLNKLQEFVTEIQPQNVYMAIGDTLQGIGTAIQNAVPAQQAIDTVRNGYREFSSLIFR